MCVKHLLEDLDQMVNEGDMTSEQKREYIMKYITINVRG